jgi:hypothetical protein
MASATQAYDAVRTRLTTGSISIPLRWHGEDNGPIPDIPEDFAYVVFDNLGSRPGPIAFGGGIGGNLYRNMAAVTVFVFVPNRAGVRRAIVEAETIAARMRSFRDTDIFCRSADVTPVGDGASIAPPGLQRNELNNYLCAVVEVDLHFDQVG